MKNQFFSHSHKLPFIILWQLFMFLLFFSGLVCLKRMAVLIKSLSKSSVTASDFSLLLTTLPGICLVLFFLMLLGLFTVLDREVKILWANSVLSGTDASFLGLLQQAFSGVTDFISPGGPSLLFIMTFFKPLIGVGAAAFLGHALKLSDFALADLVQDPAHALLVCILIAILILLGLSTMFTLPGIILSGKNVIDSLLDNIRLLKQYRKEAFHQFYLSLLYAVVSFSAFIILVMAGSLVFVPRMVTELPLRQFISVCLLITGLSIGLVGSFGLQAFLWLRMIQLYRTINGHSMEPSFQNKPPRAFIIFALMMVLLCFTAGYSLAASFDHLFPSGNTIRIIAHRAGGNLASENSVDGILAASAAGVYGSEIDVQRTLDGYYVVTHDATFERIAGDTRQPCEMTLSQIRKLNVINTWDAALPSDHIATLEEILDVSKDLQKLYIELKGVTADMKMAEDIINLVSERNMQGQVALISMNKELILSVEECFPEIETGLLYSTPLYNAASLPVDLLMMQQNKATAAAIHAIHQAGKKAIVWTVDSWDTMATFLNSDVDAIITDYVPHLMAMQKNMENRTLAQLVWDSLHCRLQLF